MSMALVRLLAVSDLMFMSVNGVRPLISKERPGVGPDFCVCGIGQDLWVLGRTFWFVIGVKPNFCVY